MFGSCGPGFLRNVRGAAGEDEDGSRRPPRLEGQRRELIIKQAERVSEHILRADIAEIQESLSDEEREFEAKASERAEERRRREKQMKEDAIAKAVSGASDKLGGTMFERIQGLGKLQKAAKTALATEITQLGLAGRRDAEESTPPTGDGNTDKGEPLKMPVPQAPWLVLKVLHPCPASLLRSKLSKALGIPVEEVRIVHRGRALKDEDVVPDDSVDFGEESKLDELGTGEGFDLSFLWMVDIRNLRPLSPPSSRSESAGAKIERKHEDKQSANSGEKQNLDREGSVDSHGTADNGLRKVGDVEHSVEVGDDKVDERATNEITGRQLVGKHQEVADKQGDGPQADDAGPCDNTDGGTPSAGVGELLPKKVLKEESDVEDSDNDENKDTTSPSDMPKPPKKAKKRVVPGSLLVTAVSASGLPDTEKGMFSKQDPYFVVKWAEQDSRTTVKRDSGKVCSWPKEELVLLVRATKQLQEDVKVEVWNDNAGDKQPKPDVLVGKGSFSVAHLADEHEAAASSASDTREMSTGNDCKGLDNEHAAKAEGTEITVELTRSDRSRKEMRPAGFVTLTLSYISPRTQKKKPAAARTESVPTVGTDDLTATDEEEDGLASLAGLSAWSIKDKRSQMSIQELGAVMSQKLEGFSIREELRKIDCFRYAQGLVNEGFGQRGAFAHIREEHMAGHPLFIPRGARKRLLALSELTRLQMKAEEENVMTAMETIKNEGTFQETYTVDGETFFDTRADLNAALEEERAKAERRKMGGGSRDENVSQYRPKSPNARRAAKEKVVRAIEAAAAAEERGIFRSYSNPSDSAAGRDKRESACCEKHAFQLQRSAVNMVEERVKNTSNKVSTWLEEADRFKNGSLPSNIAKTVMRDALLLNGLPSPRESDVRISLANASQDGEGLQFDRGKLGMELENLVRRELCTKAGVPCTFTDEQREEEKKRRDRLWGRD